MKTINFIFLCCFCLASCHSQTMNNEMTNIEKSDLKISLFFYPGPSMLSVEDIRYCITIVNDSIIIRKQKFGNKEYRGKLTDCQYLKIKKLTFALTQKYNRSEKIVKGGWGCTLKIEDQVYYEDSDFSFVSRSNETGWLPPPEEIKLLIDYIVSLSPIPIKLYSFS